MGLTDKRVAKLRKRPGRYHDQDGLYLQVSSPKSASWILRYMLNGRERMLGLGSCRAWSLKEARVRAKAARQQLSDKIDPVEAKRAQRAAEALAEAKKMTFAEAATAYFEQNEGKWKNAKHTAQYLTTFKDYAFPIIGTVPVGDVDTGLVLKVLEQKVAAHRNYPAGPSFWTARPETASRVRGRIEKVLDWATVRGYRSGDNPARWKGHLYNVLPARAQVQQINHHPALPFAELPQFMAALAHRGGAARALEFTILTAARTGEVIGATWDEIDFDNKLWTIPAARMKGGREHRVPLSARVVELLAGLHREDGNHNVFIGGAWSGGGLSIRAMTMVLKRMGRDDITVHGFRSTFRDWAAERTNYPNHVVEMALAHAISKKTERAYRRGDLVDKRKPLMEAWARFCSNPMTGGAVVPLRRGDAHGH